MNKTPEQRGQRDFSAKFGSHLQNVRLVFNVI